MRLVHECIMQYCNEKQVPERNPPQALRQRFTETVLTGLRKAQAGE
jgi:hypothetical protein